MCNCAAEYIIQAMTEKKKLLCKVPVHCSPLKQHFLWEILSLGTARDWRLDKDNYWKP